jgi:hypothetical protein
LLASSSQLLDVHPSYTQLYTPPTEPTTHKIASAVPSSAPRPSREPACHHLTTKRLLLDWNAQCHDLPHRSTQPGELNHLESRYRSTHGKEDCTSSIVPTRVYSRVIPNSSSSSIILLMTAQTPYRPSRCPHSLGRRCTVDLPLYFFRPAPCSGLEFLRRKTRQRLHVEVSNLAHGLRLPYTLSTQERGMASKLVLLDLLALRLHRLQDLKSPGSISEISLPVGFFASWRGLVSCLACSCHSRR